MPDIKIPDRIIDFGINTGQTIGIIIVGIITIKIVMKLCKTALGKTPLDVALHRFILNIIKVFLWITLTVICLSHMNANPTPFIAVLSAAGAAIALALKDSLANIAGGVMILVNKPFSRDDYVDINGVMGKVQDIDLFITHLNTYDNKVITVPNGLINTSILINYTKENKRRVDCCFGIGYEEDIGQAKEILQNIAEVNPDIYKEPEVIIGVAGQDDNRILVDMKVWCATENYWDVKYFLEENVKIAFDEAGISIPFPQMDVHIKKG